MDITYSSAISELEDYATAVPHDSAIGCAIRIAVKAIGKVSELEDLCERYRFTAESAEKRLMGFRELAACPSTVLDRNCDEYPFLTDANRAYQSYRFAMTKCDPPERIKDFGEWLLSSSSPNGDGYKRVRGVHTPDVTEESK